jgi:hypothetical protein
MQIQVMLDEKNLQQLKRNVQAILSEVSPSGATIQRAVTETAAEIADRYREAAPASDIRADVFSTRGIYRKDPTKAAQLAGIRLRGRSRPWARNYREWRARAPFTRIRFRGKRGAKRAVAAGAVMAGRLVGMSLAKMFEFGTKHIKRPRPFARRVAMAARFVFLRSMTRRVLEAIRQNTANG